MASKNANGRRNVSNKVLLVDHKAVVVLIKSMLRWLLATSRKLRPSGKG